MIKFRYKFKEHEAVELADFLQPMLEFNPEKRISSQELLHHKWLNMPANFDYIMSEKEYQLMAMIKQTAKKDKPEESSQVNVYESDTELNKADGEDNFVYASGDEDHVTDDESDGEKQIIQMVNFNNSFAAYGQYINLSACDRPNPQFNDFK